MSNIEAHTSLASGKIKKKKKVSSETLMKMKKPLFFSNTLHHSEILFHVSHLAMK